MVSNEHQVNRQIGKPKVRPRVSVILTSFNHEKYIRAAIDSILIQSFEDFELIIWDDNSSDNSWSIICSYSDPRIKAFRNDEARRAIYGVNKAITELASGEFIAIHHSDDVWEKEKLGKQIEFLDRHPEFGAVFTKAFVIGENGEPFNEPDHFYSNIFEQPNRTRHEWLNFFFFRGNALCHPSALIRKECYEACGVYRYGLAQTGDFNMWVRLCLKYEIHILPEKLVHFRVRANEANTSGNKLTTRIRGSLEYYYLLQNFLLIESIDEIVSIFPEAKKYLRTNGSVPRFVLAKVAIDTPSFPWVKLFGLEQLWGLLEDPATAKEIRSFYDFDYRDLVELTDKYDVFSVESMAAMTARLVERDAALAERDAALAERDAALAERDAELAEYDAALAARDAALGLIERMQTSYSWRLTNPFRVFFRLLRRGLRNYDQQLLVQVIRKLYHRMPLAMPVGRALSRFGDLAAPLMKHISTNNKDKFIVQKTDSRRKQYNLRSPLFPHGHFYSPLADPQDLVAREKKIWEQKNEMPGIDFNEAGQLKLLSRMSSFADSITYPEEKTSDQSSYYYKNDQYPVLDADVLFSLLCLLKPKIIIEVGCGFSSLITADVNQRVFGGKLKFSCIEPFPRQFLLDGVPGISNLVVKKVEDVELDFFDRLGDGDILFIDSSHVSKVGSDVNYLFFEVIPRLRPGVIVHIHDIFLPDEYPKVWMINEGRNWNEQYIVRAFLQFNNSFEVLWAAHFMATRHTETVSKVFPRFPRLGGGGSLWLRKK